MRVGFGYDAHRLTYGRRLVLGGVDIPYEKGLDGHSDADVLLHAIMDALLGAAALGDIGTNFPDTEKAYEGISSLKLLEKVGKKLDDNNYQIINIDSTIVAQKPKLKDYIEDMKRNIADCLGLLARDVSVKATTEEKMGFTGDGTGISSYAVCLIEGK